MSNYSQPRLKSSVNLSRSMSRSMYTSISDLQELTDEELLKQIEVLKKDIRILTIENEILERVIMRVEPALMASVQQAMDYITKLQSTTNLQGSMGRSTTSKFGMSDNLPSPSARLLSSPSRVSARRVESSARFGTAMSSSGPKINVLERSELANQETDILVRKIEKSRRKAQREQALLTAQIEEIGVRVQEIEKSTVVFNKEVIIDGVDQLTKKIPAEVWLRFMNEWVGLCDKEIGKLRLRTSTANTQFARQEIQIKTKTELSQNLRPVDFDKLKIENKVCLENIEKKFGYLYGLKRMTGKANLNLTIHKQSMLVQNNYLMKVQQQIDNRHEWTKAKIKESKKIGEQLGGLEHKYEEVKRHRSRWEVPDIMEYVQVKTDLSNLQQFIKTLERRMHIQQIALKSLHKQIHSMSFL